MGVYRAAIITESGQNLIAQAIAGAGQIQFSHAKTSSYAYPASTNIQGLTDLQDIKQTAVPFSAKVFDDTVVQVSVRFENTEVSEAYLIQTIGLYAQIGDSAEILFSVVQANTPDQMPVESSVSPSAFIYNIQSTVQQATQISVTVNPAGTATVQDILDIENPEFDDSGIVESITGFPQFLEKFKSKMNLFQWFRDFKAGAQFLLHVGSIVNNCVSSDADKPLAAAQGKVLMDMVNQLNSRLIKELSTSILDYALTLSYGMHTVYLSGDNYSDSDLPSNIYKYSSASIFVRNSSSIVVILYGVDIYPIMTNCYNGSNWIGWNSYVRSSDLTYTDLSSKITVNSSYVNAYKFFVEGGVVTLYIELTPGWSGSQTVATISGTKYVPNITEINMSYATPRSSSDKGKCLSSRIRIDGQVVVWLESDLAYAETISCVYPMRSS